MKPDESKQALQDLAASRGIDLNASTLREGIEAMLAFRAQTVCVTCSDDMLLYQWGSYDWGNGRYFEVNITRQFIEAEGDGDDAISQLSLTYRYRPASGLDAFGADNRWEDQPGDFREFILTSAPFLAVADAKPDHIDLSHSYV